MIDMLNMMQHDVENQSTENGNSMKSYKREIAAQRNITMNDTLAELGAFIALTDLQIETEEPLDLDVDRLCNMIGAASVDERNAVARCLAKHFECTDSGFVSRAATSIIERQKRKSAARREICRMAGKASAKARRTALNAALSQDAQ